MGGEIHLMTVFRGRARREASEEGVSGEGSKAKQTTVLRARGPS